MRQRGSYLHVLRRQSHYAPALIGLKTHYGRTTADCATTVVCLTMYYILQLPVIVSLISVYVQTCVRIRVFVRLGRMILTLAHIIIIHSLIYIFYFHKYDRCGLKGYLNASQRSYIT